MIIHGLKMPELAKGLFFICSPLASMLNEYTIKQNKKTQHKQDGIPQHKTGHHRTNRTD
jgi:hypothetical protein